MAEHHHVCPWWMGYFLINPLRRLMQDPVKILSPYVRDGMVVLEVGPGMGYFSLPLARMVGPAGKIVAVDIQKRMLQALEKRLGRAGLGSRVECRLSAPDTLGIDGKDERFDFALAFAVVHEVPDHNHFFRELYSALKPGGKVLIADPKSHFSAQEQEQALATAKECGFEKTDEPAIWRSRTAILRKNG
jgi:ubiquinone/menaquinone biosynthesis C-methylase UbiE